MIDFQGQGPAQIGGLLLAFVLASAIGLERQLRGKSAGLRTQALVGTTAAAILLVSKYGFGDVLSSGLVVLDPSRIAAQVVSGIGFLGAGLILARRGVIRGLTTAAAVWETAAVGLAAGAGLWLIAVVVTALHFVTVYGYTLLARRLPGSAVQPVRLRVLYVQGHGALRTVLNRLTSDGWRVDGLIGLTAADRLPDGTTGVDIEAAGAARPDDLRIALLGLDDVIAVSMTEGEELE
ncbi:MgtC/SapB family protein [Nakamurella flava]|uniref:MgtC/SapB family protein n=1 Tax=Nakamurella flava TaxID=2576308 RepID=A0A4V6CRH2_9ACTN|nr:MgtC/SapB family protein [Nakamurella flava]TKV56135.1 MgtC/SapB family protein [Nakamurella flava]